MVAATWTTGGSWRKVLALKIIEAPQPAKADELTAEGIHCNRCVVTLNRIESSIKSIKTDHNPLSKLSHCFDWTYHIYISYDNRNPMVFIVGWVSHWPSKNPKTQWDPWLWSPPYWPGTRSGIPWIGFATAGPWTTTWPGQPGGFSDVGSPKMFGS